MAGTNCRVLFVVGASGSGTTMLTRVLASVPGVVALGGNYTSYSSAERGPWSVVLGFGRATAELWDRQSTWEGAERARSELPLLLDRLRGMAGQEHVTHVVYKRSAPFFRGDRHRPDLSDLPGIFEDWRLIIVYRDPCAAVYSTFRRRFSGHLRQCALICEEQLTRLSAQAATLDPRSFQVLPFEGLCADPRRWATRLAAFCGLPELELTQAVERENPDSTRNGRWQQELPPADVRRLASFFDDRRRAQWPLLGHAHEPEPARAEA